MEWGKRDGKGSGGCSCSGAFLAALAPGLAAGCRAGVGGLLAGVFGLLAGTGGTFCGAAVFSVLDVGLRPNLGLQLVQQGRYLLERAICHAVDDEEGGFCRDGERDNGGVCRLRHGLLHRGGCWSLYVFARHLFEPARAVVAEADT